MAFGDQLKDVREARGIPLEAVAEATRIAPRNLAALERSDLDDLPRGPFGRGYVRSYAEYLGIDPQPILQAYHSLERERGLGPSATQRRTLDELSQIVQHRAESRHRGPLSRRLAWVAGALAALAILGAGGWLVIGRGTPEADAPAPVPPATERSSEAGEMGDAPEAQPQPPSRQSRLPERSDPESPPSRAGLQVSDSGVGAGVRNHQLVGRAGRFVEGAFVSYWTRVVGGGPGDAIHHVWTHDGQVVMTAELELGGSPWRTHSRLALPQGSAGRWVVETRIPNGGLVLAREEFLCVSEEP